MILKKIIEFLNQEHQHKQPRLAIIPNFIINLIGLIFYLIIIYKVFMFIINKLF